MISVHCKDAHSPAKGSGLLGSECVLGDGEVNIPAFLKELKGSAIRVRLALNVKSQTK